MQKWPSGSIFTKHLNLNVISTMTRIIRCSTPAVRTYCPKIKTTITGNNLNTIFIWFCTRIGQLRSHTHWLWCGFHDKISWVCVCVFYKECFSMPMFHISWNPQWICESECVFSLFSSQGGVFWHSSSCPPEASTSRGYLKDIPGRAASCVGCLLTNILQ